MIKYAEEVDIGREISKWRRELLDFGRKKFLRVAKKVKHDK